MSTVAELLVKIGADSSDLRKEIAATKRQLKSAFGSEGMRERGEKYKVEHIGDLDDDARITFYKQGEYVDMSMNMPSALLIASLSLGATCLRRA